MHLFKNVFKFARDCEISDNNRKNWMKVEHVQLSTIISIFLKYTFIFLYFYILKVQFLYSHLIEPFKRIMYFPFNMH